MSNAANPKTLATPPPNHTGAGQLSLPVGSRLSLHFQSTMSIPVPTMDLSTRTAVVSAASRALCRVGKMFGG